MNRSRAPVQAEGHTHATQLLDAFAEEVTSLLAYLDEEYFEDIEDDPRFERINNLLSLQNILKNDPNDPNLARFFAELRRPQVAARRPSGIAAGNGHPKP